MNSRTKLPKRSDPWDKGRLVGQKAPLKLKEIWAIRIRLQLAEKARDLAPFNLAIDSKLRGCDLVSLRVLDVAQGKAVLRRAMVMQHKTHRPVPFEITEQTRQSVAAWIDKAHLALGEYLFPSRVAKSPHLSTRQYACIVARWVESIGLDASAYGTHPMRRTKATLIYRQTKNLRAVQLLLGHTKLESTVRYLDIEVDDALEIAEQTEVSHLVGERRRAAGRLPAMPSHSHERCERRLPNTKQTLTPKRLVESPRGYLPFRCFFAYLMPDCGNYDQQIRPATKKKVFSTNSDC